MAAIDSPRTRRPSGLVPVVALLGVALGVAARWLPQAERTSVRVPADAAVAGRGPGDGARRIAALVDDVLEHTDPATHRFLSSARAERLRRVVETNANPDAGLATREQLARELLNAGRPEEAVVELGRLIPAIEAAGGVAKARGQRTARFLLALAYLRIGEQANCVAHRGAESCICPIAGSGVHADPSGSRRATAELTALLETDPEDLASRWLLNLAAMTLGEWPAGVAERWRIGPEAFASEHHIGRFPEEALASGMRERGLAGGALADDFDGDGDLDVILSHMNERSRLSLYRNRGDRTFEDGTAGSGLDEVPGGLNLVHADYDNDGDLDVFVLRGAWLQPGRYPNSLLRNRGHGRFDDVTEEAGLLTFRPTQVGAWADYDGDGWLDLFVGNESLPENPVASELWRNDRDGSFTDRTADLPEADLGWVKGAAWGDFDNDGRPDLYVSVHGGENRLLRNDGPRAEAGAGGAAAWSFVDVSRQAGVEAPRQSFPTWWFDYDNDGWQDILVAGYDSPRGLVDVASLYLGRPHEMTTPHLYRNQRDGTFRDVSHQVRIDRAGLVMGANFGDLDGDGWLDVYLGTGEPALALLLPNRMFRNDGGRAFQDVTTSGGFGHLQKGHGIAFADLDGDGDQDVVETMGGAFEGDPAFTALYRNPGHGNRWITLKLEGRRSNRSAIGARLRARVREAGGERDVYLTAGSGGSFGGSSLEQEMGLGRAEELVELEVRWPGSGLVQRFPSVAIDRCHRLVEGGTLEPCTRGSGARASLATR